MKAEQKIAIYGGSFDPPHYGHFDIVSNLEKKFDKVIVVPSYISPFKADGVSDNAKLRLKLCKKFFTSDKTEVLSREINKKGVSYSVDTAAYLAKKYDAKLFWVIGSEEVARLSEWHNINKLKKLVTFYVVPRPGYTVSAEQLKQLKKLGIKTKVAPFVGLDISSTEIKIDIAFGVQNKFMPYIVQKEVAGGEFNPYQKYVDCLYKYKLSKKRVAHTYGVAKRGAELAKLYGYSVNTAVIACILHDVAKSVNPEDYIGKVDTTGFPTPTVHGPIGEYIARKEFGVDDDTAHAIRFHSTGDGKMNLLDEIVYLADKTEEGRSYNEVFYYRFLCSVDKDFAMLKTLSSVSEYKDICPCDYTAQAIELYTKRCDGKTEPEMPKEKDVGAPLGTLPIVHTGKGVAVVPTKDVKPVVEKQTHLQPAQKKEVLSVDQNKQVSVVEKNTEIVAKPIGEKSPSVTTETSKAVRLASDFNKAALKTISGEEQMRQVALAVASELNLHKARDIDIVDLKGKTIIADFFVIASVTSSTAVKAQCNYVEDILTKQFGMDPLRRDIDSEWAALDYGGVIVHIFTEKMREFYDIERLWVDGDNVTRIGD